ncbi:MAG: hypothetical protein DME90_02935 [Verrucomicrobia bacterium]|nr:MAG: hypothetical protein DME90_02935 [Verrucomicrobiota bacterium]
MRKGLARRYYAGALAMFDAERSWTRREFLKLAGRAGLLSGVPTLASAATAFNSDTVCISILHTTDIHGHILPTFDYDGNSDRGGLARCVTQIRRWRRQNPNSILIDVGDVYQGTEVSLRNKGELMIDLFNHLGYDAWVVGNHEFDWGIEPFHQALQRSVMPVLAANTLLEGKPVAEFPDAKHPLAKIQPFILKEVAGIKLAIIGITTPMMSFWLPREFARGMGFQRPIEPVRRAIARVKSEGADAIVLTGHMGLKPRTGGDDFANSVTALTSEFPDVAVFIAGHTHQSIPSRLTNSVLFTQADHFGIHVGRVDLLFDRNSKKLLGREAICELMDNRLHLDDVVISRAKPQLTESDAALMQPIGELAQTLRANSRPGNPIWNVIPYENFIVTAALSPDELKAVMEEVYASHERRNLLGFDVKLKGRGWDCKITSMTMQDGRPLDRGKKYLIAFNSFDSRSAGHHFMKLRALLETPSAKSLMHPVQTRDALIDYFRRHKIVHRIATAGELAAVA